MFFHPLRNISCYFAGGGPGREEAAYALVVDVRTSGAAPVVAVVLPEPRRGLVILQRAGRGSVWSSVSPSFDDDRGQYGTACAAGDRLRDNAAHAEIS